MVKPALKSLIGATVGATALSLMSVSTAQAAMLNFSFNVRIDNGLNQGNHTGTFRFDRSRMVTCPVEGGSALCATPAAGGLSVLFNFMGRQYTHVDDVDYRTRNYPAVYYFPNLDIYYLSFIFLAPDPKNSFSILGREFYTNFSTVSKDDKGDLVGAVSYFRLPSPNPGNPSPCQQDPSSCQGAAVPEPTEIGGAVVAAGALGWLWRSRRKKATFKP